MAANPERRKLPLRRQPSNQETVTRKAQSGDDGEEEPVLACVKGIAVHAGRSMTCQALLAVLLKSVLKCFADPVEKNRELSITLLHEYDTPRSRSSRLQICEGGAPHARADGVRHARARCSHR